MTFNQDINIIYNYLHEQSESLTSSQLLAFNDAISALKTLQDAKTHTSNISRETMLGAKLLEIANFNCTYLPCGTCPHLSIDPRHKLPHCQSNEALKLIEYIEKETNNHE